MKKLSIFLILLFLVGCGGKRKTTTSVESEYTACLSCGKYEVDVVALAQLNTRARNRSTLTRGSHTFPGCQGVDNQYVCFVSGKNLFCGPKKALGVFVTSATSYCNSFKTNKTGVSTK